MTEEHVVRGKAIFMRTDTGEVTKKHVIFPEINGSTRITEHLIDFVEKQGSEVENK